MTYSLSPEEFSHTRFARNPELYKFAIPSLSLANVVNRMGYGHEIGFTIGNVPVLTSIERGGSCP